MYIIIIEFITQPNNIIVILQIFIISYCIFVLLYCSYITAAIIIIIIIYISVGAFDLCIL